MSFSTPTTAAILFTGLYSAYYVAVHPPTIEPQLSFGSVTLFCTIVATIVAAYFSLFVIPAFFNTEEFNLIKGASGRIFRIANSPRGFMGHAHPIIDRSDLISSVKGSEILFSCGEDYSHRHPNNDLYGIRSQDISEAIKKIASAISNKSVEEIYELTEGGSYKQGDKILKQNLSRLISTEKINVNIYRVIKDNTFDSTHVKELVRSSLHEHYLNIELFTENLEDIDALFNVLDKKIQAIIKIA